MWQAASVSRPQLENVYPGPADRLRPAAVYDLAPDLWLVTAYFNPLGYASRRRNYELFREPIMRGGLKLVTIECAFGSDDFTLPPSPDVLRVRADDLLWQKERMLNLALARLPPECAKVVWLDADLLFENPAWAVETSRALERHRVVQPFDVCIRMPARTIEYSGGGVVTRSFGALSGDAPPRRTLPAGGSLGGAMDEHGYTGFAWAARRDVLARGLYDACIIGGADHAMAHAMRGDLTSPCVDVTFPSDTAHRRHFLNWAESFHRAVAGDIGCVAGAALHLWHGARVHRRYTLRHKELARFDFDPVTDLRIGEGGCWQWASAKPALHEWAAEYFAGRMEDNEIQGTSPADASP
jgi:hypothetical protein